MNNCLLHKQSKGLSFSEPSKCQTHLARLCDVGYMIERAVMGDSTVYRHGSYGDVTGVPEDLQGVLNLGIKGREAYESLPDEVKRHYPSADVFLAAVSDPTQRDNLLRLGVLSKPETSQPVKVEVINNHPVTPPERGN